MALQNQGQNRALVHLGVSRNAMILSESSLLFLKISKKLTGFFRNYCDEIKHIFYLCGGDYLD